MASLVALFGLSRRYRRVTAEARPLATVVMAGYSPTPFTLYVLPILYKWIHQTGTWKHRLFLGGFSSFNFLEKRRG